MLSPKAIIAIYLLEAAAVFTVAVTLYIHTV
jgi:hypothetical protein